MFTRAAHKTALLGSAALAVAAIALAPSGPASAAGWDDIAALASCTNDVDDPVVVQLTLNVVEEAAVPVACNVEIDLNGFTLDVSSIQITPGHTLVIDDTSAGATGNLIADWAAGIGPIGGAGIQVPAGATLEIRNGTVDARGDNPNGPGIGNQATHDAGTIIISGGNVTAIGRNAAAGIGGGIQGDGGDVTITGGTVIATGGPNGGAGIGGGNDGAAGTTTITGGTVNATGGSNGAGIGGGSGRAGGTITIANATVTATGGYGGAGIGGGAGAAGGTVTIDGGTVNAFGGDLAAGIGGGVNGAGGTTTIEGGTVIAIGGEEEGAGIGGGGLGGGHGGLTTITGGTVIATGGNDGAGIGGGERGSGGLTTITGGTVTATGVGDAAGIGGGEEGHGSTTTISGGSVTANGGRNSAGIGGGEYGDGGATTISDGVATITGGPGAPAIGSGCGATSTGPISIGAPAVVFATAGDASACGGAAPAIVIPAVGGPGLAVDGVLHLSSSVLVDVPDHGPDPAIVVGPLGVIMGPDGTPTAGSGFTGAGTIENNGVIAFASDHVEVPVGNHNYLVTFNPSAGPPYPVRVFASTFSTGYRTAMSPTVGTAWAVEGADRWWSEGETLTGDLNLVEADATARTVTLLPAGPITAGDSVALQTIVADVFGAPVVPAPPLTFTSSNASDQISGNTLTATQAGSRTVTATEPVTGANASIVLTVSPGPLAALQLSASATTVAQGDSVTITVTGRDAHGNPVDASAAVLTSSVASDIVDGRVVTFPTASPHVITATLGEVSASLTIEVTPPAVATTTTTTTTTVPAVPTTSVPTTVAPILPATGGSALPLLTAALALLATGTLAITATRRR